MLKLWLQQFIIAEITQAFGLVAGKSFVVNRDMGVAVLHSLRVAAKRMKPLPSAMRDLHTPSSENCGLTHSSIMYWVFIFFWIFLSFFVCLPINLSKFRAPFRSNAGFECCPGQMGSWWRSPGEIIFQRIEVAAWFSQAAVINHWSFALFFFKQTELLMLFL